jgi:cytochrome c
MEKASHTQLRAEALALRAAIVVLVGPRHRGVVGRAAGSVPGYAYSPGLKNSHIVWDRDRLDQWLTNPQALVPGAKMFFALPNAQDRADVIAFLAEQR